MWRNSRKVVDWHCFVSIVFLSVIITVIPEETSSKNISQSTEYPHTNSNFFTTPMRPQTVTSTISADNMSHVETYALTIYSNCQTRCTYIGGHYEIFIDILTHRNKSYMPTEIDFPVPQSDTKTEIVVSKCTVIHRGKNWHKFNPEDVKFKQLELLDYRIKDINDARYRGSQMSIPAVKNIGTSPNISDDKITIQILIQHTPLKLQSSQRKQVFGIRVNYNGSQVDDFSHQIEIKKPVTFPSPVIIKGIVFKSLTAISPNSNWVRYSINGSQFMNNTIPWTGGPLNSSHEEYHFVKPLIASSVFVRELSQPKPECCFDVEFIIMKLQENIETLQDKDDAIMSKMYQVFDGSNHTCLPLPVIGKTPSLFGARINISAIFGITSAYQLVVTGTGITCNKHGMNSLMVSFPMSDSSRGFEGNLQSCVRVNTQESTHAGLTSCVFSCGCTTFIHCQELIIFMATMRADYSWSLCEAFPSPIE